MVISTCSRSNHRFCKKIQLLLVIVNPLCGSMHVVRPSVVLIPVLPRRSSQGSESARNLTYPLFGLSQYKNQFMPISAGTSRSGRSRGSSKVMTPRVLTTLLGFRHTRTQSRHNAATLSTNDSDRCKSLRGHYCGESAAMRTHASKQSTRPPMKTRLALVCVNSNSNSEARLKGARSEIFCVKRSWYLIHHVHTHSKSP